MSESSSWAASSSTLVETKVDFRSRIKHCASSRSKDTVFLPAISAAIFFDKRGNRVIYEGLVQTTLLVDRIPSVFWRLETDPSATTSCVMDFDADSFSTSAGIFKIEVRLLRNLSLAPVGLSDWADRLPTLRWDRNQHDWSYISAFPVSLGTTPNNIN